MKRSIRAPWQSRRVRGLYFSGELIDIDADTGGYNLQAAFSTGYLAGECGSRKLARLLSSGHAKGGKQECLLCPTLCPRVCRWQAGIGGSAL